MLRYPREKGKSLTFAPLFPRNSIISSPPVYTAPPLHPSNAVCRDIAFRAQAFPALGGPRERFLCFQRCRIEEIEREGEGNFIPFIGYKKQRKEGLKALKKIYLGSSDFHISYYSNRREMLEWGEEESVCYLRVFPPFTLFYPLFYLARGKQKSKTVMTAVLPLFTGLFPGAPTPLVTCRVYLALSNLYFPGLCTALLDNQVG